MATRTIDRHASDDLHSTLGSLHSWAGWLALDSADHQAADGYLKDALVQARLTDDPCLEAEVLDTFCMLHRNRPRQALDCADAATSVSRGWATPRLEALLCLRRAVAHAKLGDASAWSRQIARAARHLDAGESDDDPLFTMFVNEQELTGIRGISLLSLGEPERAVEEFRSIIENPDPDRQRNTAYYHVHLGLALAEAGDIAEASHVGCDALHAATGVESLRTMHHLQELHTLCSLHMHSAAARDFDEQYRQLA